jgi:single-strand DNA-binding protein
MNSSNHVQLIGYMGQDPELRYTASGKTVANFTVATTEKWQDQNGQTKERVSWHKIVVWGNLAESCAKLAGKGSRVLLQGKLQYRTYESNGQNYNVVEVIASNIQFLTYKNQQKSAMKMEEYSDAVDQKLNPEVHEKLATKKKSKNEPNSDDIPF